MGFAIVSAGIEELCAVEVDQKNVKNKKSRVLCGDCCFLTLPGVLIAKVN